MLYPFSFKLQSILRSLCHVRDKNKKQKHGYKKKSGFLWLQFSKKLTLVISVVVVSVHMVQQKQQKTTETFDKGIIDILCSCPCLSELLVSITKEW